MNLINFSSASCRNCYKCLRSCPVKAIQFKNEQAVIIEDRCIACGHCLVVCPQNARYIKSDLERIKEAIENKKTLVASIAPSFAGAFEMEDEGQIVSALLKLGFDFIEETAIGAEKVSAAYKDYIKRENPENIITTCCPSANYLIEKYYPSLIKYMLPFVSPMLAHGKMLKSFYGSDSFTVFIGPCTAKKYEAIDLEHEGTIDAVITFEELKKWFEDEKIDLKGQKPSMFEKLSSTIGRIYPVKGGVLGNITENSNRVYEKITVDGIENCMEVFGEMQAGKLKETCVEVNACPGGCLGGPGMTNYSKGFYLKNIKIKKYSVQKSEVPRSCSRSTDECLNYSKLFIDKSIVKEKYDEDQISNILKKMGKFEPSDELNCSVCGYNTCREKAQAIYEGMAEVDMCLHFMRTRAESLTNIIFGNSPNIIIILDTDMNVKEFNPAAESVFSITAGEINGKPISVILDDKNFIAVKETGMSKYNQKLVLNSCGRIFLQNILYLEKQNVILVIMNDITLDEKHKQELKKVKESTLNAAQEVINKQMRVAQEIASLLGETTAETKVILTKLKNLAAKEDGED